MAVRTWNGGRMDSMMRLMCIMCRGMLKTEYGRPLLSFHSR